MDAASSLRASLRLALGPVAMSLTAVAVLLGIFLLVPILIIFPVSLTSDFFLTWPPDLVSLRWFETIFESPVWTAALTKSVRIALPVAVISTLLGTLAALGIAYLRRWRRLLQTLFIAPLVLPIITYALGMYDVAQRFDLTGSSWPVIIGQAMLATPIVFIIVSAGLAGRDPQLPQAAASLGAPGHTVLWRIELPLLRVSIAAAALVALAYSFDEIIVAYFLSPPGAGTLPVQILQTTRETADPSIAAASMVVIAVATSIAALVLLARVVLRTPER
jgi:ABC-type spermidine/putrescine transport system permease subunit II